MTQAGLYVHVPFCRSVCPYCDFAVTLAGEERRLAWERGLLKEAELYRGRGWSFETVYFGGGTPSNLCAGRFGRVLGGLRDVLSIGEAFVSIEANPEDVTVDAVRGWRRLGVEYLSLGVQSFDDDQLAFLGRTHSAMQAEKALTIALEAGFRTVSADLIFGLPGQSATAWRRELRTAVDLGVQHISCYQLTVHSGTIFGLRHRTGLLTEASEDQQAELYMVAHEVLSDAGLEAYEVSNFARPGHRSEHNLFYWTGRPYLGLGPGAHSFDGRFTRWWNRRKLRLWQRDVDRRRPPVEDREELGSEERALECLMLGLRQTEGVDLADLERRFQVDILRANERMIEDLVRRDLLVHDGVRLRPTERGLAVADGLVRSLVIGAVPTPET